MMLVALLLVLQDDEIRIVHQAIVEATKGKASLTCSDVLRPALSQKGVGPKAALLAACYFIDPNLAKLPVIGETWKGIDPRTGGEVTLRNRGDWAKHFAWSAVLTLMTGEKAARAAGLAKEISDAVGMDAGSGSGFSFGDLAADEVGIAFTRHLLEKTVDTADVNVERYFPDPQKLPEGLGLKELNKSFTATEIKQMHQEICDKIEACYRSVTDAVELRLRLKPRDELMLKIKATVKRAGMQTAFAIKSVLTVKDVDNVGIKAELNIVEAELETREGDKTLMAFTFKDRKIDSLQGPPADRLESIKKSLALALDRGVPVTISSRGVAQFDKSEEVIQSLYMTVFAAAFSSPLPQVKAKPGDTWQETLIDQFEIPGSELKLTMAVDRIQGHQAWIKSSGQVAGKAATHKVSIETVFDWHTGTPVSNHVVASMSVDGKEQSAVDYQVVYTR